MKGKPFLHRVELTVGSYSGGQVDLTWTPPDWARCAIVGMSVGTRDAMVDHQVLAFEHNEYNAVTKSTVSSTEYGVPLCHVACHLTHAVGGDATPVRPQQGLRLWPGQFKSPYLPCERDFALIPVKGTRQVKITAKRIYGSTSIARAYLWLIPFENQAEHARLCDGRQRLIGAPHWLGQKLELAAASGLETAAIERKFNAYDDFNLRVRQLFGTGYYNNGGTISHDPTYAAATLLRLRNYDNSRVVPEYADGLHRVPELCSQMLPEFDCLRDPQVVVQAKRGLRLDAERETTTYQKDVWLSFYGVLEDALAEAA